jgi:transcriptional regulator EpsA
MYAAEQALQPKSEAIVRFLESSSQVRRRHQFFGWVQTHLKDLLPNAVVSAGVYQRAQRSLAFDIFNSVLLPPAVQGELGDGRSELLRRAIELWVDAQTADRPRALLLEPALVLSTQDRRAVFAEAGLRQLLVHGVSRPQRQAELECFFVFTEPHHASGERELHCLELLLPNLHTTYLRVRATESEMGIKPTAAPALSAPRAAAAALTEREQQILACVRDGYSNAQIGHMLAISPLTVKNHVQNILRKLGAVNRAQAVAKAGAAGVARARADDAGGTGRTRGIK